jgi:hypothetical protein
MNEYLDNYGVADARRERLWKRIGLGVLAVAVLGGTLWFLFRNYKEEGRVKDFLSLLERREYKSAYALWGCTDETPCRDYNFERFLQDWGEKSDAADVSAIRRAKVKTCDHGIIQVLEIKGQEVHLYVDSASLVLGFSPWPVCNPRVKL